MSDKRIVKVIFFFALITASCKKYLDFQPRDFVFENELFSSPDGVRSALNGIYRSLSSPSLYGQDLTFYRVDLMGLSYRPNGFEDLTDPEKILDYTLPEIKTSYSSIWTNTFRTILNLNNFCVHLEQPSFSIVPEEEKDRMLGEAYAVRAMLHLDMLRLFGPVPATGNGKPCIPYVTVTDFQTQPLLPETQVIDNVVKDLSKAEILLKSDLALKDTLLNDRRWRVNYFAVKTLLARAYLYAGKNEAAWKVVGDELNRTNVTFPWMASAGEAVADPVFFAESLFGVENKKLYQFYRDFFSPLVEEKSILVPGRQKFDKLFDNINDYRRQSWFTPGTAGNKAYDVFVKYSDAMAAKTNHRYFQPIIRKAELVLIGVETAPDARTAYSLLNSLRVNRGLQPVKQQDSRSQLLSDILREYQREFYGEGQVFYLYKRRNLSAIPDPLSGGLSFNMTGKYQVPIPEQETLYR